MNAERPLPLSTIRILDRLGEESGRGVPYVLGGRAVYRGDSIKVLHRSGIVVKGVILEVDAGAMYPLRVQHTDGRIERFNHQEFV